MTASSEMDTKQALRVVLGLVRLFGELAVLVSALLCTAFTTVASGTLLVFVLASPDAAGHSSSVKLAIKALAFGIISVLILLRLRWLRPYLRRMPYPEVTLILPEHPARRFLLLGVLGAGVLAALNVSDYPRAEPDEVHHLIVARNLALHGEYASGHPDAGFLRFDAYDSVGPTVIVPVAGALRLCGVDLLPARLVMAGFYVALLLAAYALFLPLFDGVKSVFAVLFLSTALGTLYLGRTLYGEIPALLFITLGLLSWRQALRREGGYLWLGLSGTLLGLAIITKMFAVFVLWAVFAACVYDRLTFRRIRLVHLWLPGVSTALVLGVWMAIQGAYQTVDAGVASGQLAMYQHNLMFGLGSAPRTLGWLYRHGAMTAVSAFGMLVAGGWVFYRRYDPVMVVLYLFGVFVAYWWIFFTTGNLPRYLWYALAISASFAGPVVGMALSGSVRKRDGRWRVRPLRLFAAIALCAPFAINLGHELASVLSRNDMQDERALGDYVSALPRDTEIVTTYYPAARTMNFLAGRNVARIPETKEDVENHSVVIVDTVSQRALVDMLGANRRIGRYAVYEYGAR